MPDWVAGFVGWYILATYCKQLATRWERTGVKRNIPDSTSLQLDWGTRDQAGGKDAFLAAILDMLRHGGEVAV